MSQAAFCVINNFKFYFKVGIKQEKYPKIGAIKIIVSNEVCKFEIYNYLGAF